MRRAPPSTDYELEVNTKYFSADSSHYLIFDTGGSDNIGGNLFLRKNENDEVIWQALTQNSDVDTVFLQTNGNLVIYDSNRNSLWTSVLSLLQKCQGNCEGDENCADGLVCYDHSPSPTNIPGCSGFNYGETNYCVDPTITEHRIEPLNNLATKSGYLKLRRPLELCEGHCEVDTNCRNGLICKEQDSNGSVEGCFGASPKEGWKYCTYPSLAVIDNTNSDLSLRSISDSFLRIDNSGVLKLYSKGNGLIWDSNGGVTSQLVPCESSCEFDESYDISIATARDIIFAGSYSHVDYAIDVEESSDSGLFVTSNSIQVKGTISEAYEFLSPLHVDSSTSISFKFGIADGVKGFALCVDDGIKKRVQSDGRVLSHCLALGGSSISEVLTTYATVEDMGGTILSPDQNTTEVEFELSRLFPSRIGKIKYLGILQVMNDNFFTDDSYSLIQDISFIYNSDTNRGLNQVSNDMCVCKSDELAATIEPGLHHSCKAVGDFCTSAKNILSEITKNEKEPCSTHSECRSGICGDGTNKVCSSEVRALFTTSIFILY